MDVPLERVRWRIAGSNHMAWLLELTLDGEDLYPEVRKRAFELNDRALDDPQARHDDMVRFEILRHFGYYVTESSEHNAEYTPYWIKSSFPELVEQYNVPLDEYPRRCEEQISQWKAQGAELTASAKLDHARTDEYGSVIMESIVGDSSARIHGNVLNRGAIPNLPADAVVEVACLVDGNGVQATQVGSLPPQCAALNRTNINVQDLAIQAALTGSRELVYQAAYLDPHTAAELPLARIRELCDRLIDAHGEYLPALT